MRIRRFVYWLGFRPKPGNLFFSPSLDLVRARVLEGWLEGFRKGLDAEADRLWSLLPKERGPLVLSAARLSRDDVRASMAELYGERDR